MPPSAASAAIASVLRWNEKLASPMDSSKCLATLWRLTTAPTLRAISASPRSGLRARRTAAAMTARAALVVGRRAPRLARRSARAAGEIGVGRRQQVLALARALAREIGIAADDQPLARIVGRRDRCHVTLGEQRHLQRPGLDQRPDGWRAQRRDPVEPGRGDLGIEARLRDHATIADQRHTLEGGGLLDLVDVARKRARIAGVALEHLDGHRATVGGAQQAVDDLQLALLAVAVVAEPRQLAAAALHIARGHVVEHQRAVVQMLARERLLDRLLALAKPVERDIELVLVDRPEAEHLAEAR